MKEFLLEFIYWLALVVGVISIVLLLSYMAMYILGKVISHFGYWKDLMGALKIIRDRKLK